MSLLCFYLRMIVLSMVCWETITAASLAGAVEVPASVRAEEQRRVEVVRQISRSTIAIFDSKASGGGSGVVIDPSGYAITNFHVTAPCGAVMIVGTSDGKAHQAVIVAIDPSGDIALIKLLGKQPYVAAPIGDSDLCRVGDEVLVAGNPFLLADDFSPTITAGILSGTHRYQPPSGSLLEYADCLQTDASINPGNSGGPLFNRDGELIGINGRGSFEKRGRVNVGVGYAVSINQVMRFLPFLKSGRIVDHAFLGATVRTDRGVDESRAVVDAIRTDSDAYRRGLRPGDELLMFGDQEIRSANELLNLVGVCPPGWRVPIVYRRNTELFETTVRLGFRHTPAALREGVAKMAPEAEKTESKKTKPKKSDEPWRAFYEADDGFANRYFNRLETKRALATCRLHALDLSKVQLLDEKTNETVTLEVFVDQVNWESPNGRFRLNAKRAFDEQRVPAKSPGLLAGFWIWQAIQSDNAAMLDDYFYVGRLPWDAEREPLDVVRAWHRGAKVDFYFSPADGTLIGWEVVLDEADDPIRMEFTATGEWRILMGEQLLGNYRLQNTESSEGGTL